MWQKFEKIYMYSTCGNSVKSYCKTAWKTCQRLSTIHTQKHQSDALTYGYLPVLPIRTPIYSPGFAHPVLLHLPLLNGKLPTVSTPPTITTKKFKKELS